MNEREKQALANYTLAEYLQELFIDGHRVQGRESNDRRMGQTECIRNPSKGYNGQATFGSVRIPGSALQGTEVQQQPGGVDVSAKRKGQPVFSGVLAYFPDALMAIAELSKAGNDKHNPGQPLHWSKDKSNDHADCLARHLLEQGTIDPEDGISHTVKVAWRALALLQIEIEESKNGKQ